MAHIGAFALTLALLTALPLRAQTLTQGAVEGVVRDGAGNPLSGVVITLYDRTGYGSTTRTSGKDGRFVVGQIPPGEYDLLMEAFGHRPLRVRMLIIRAGAGTRLDVALPDAVDGVVGVIDRPYNAGGNGASEQLSTSELSRFPEHGRLVSSALRLSSNSNAMLETEGLPAHLNGVRLDGLPIAPSLGGGANPVPVTLPLSLVRSAELLSGKADLEWSGSAGALLSAHSVVAGNRAQFRSFGDWSNATLDRGGLSAPDHNGIRAGGVLATPIVRDTVGLVLGAEFWRLDAPIARPPRIDSVSGLVLDAAQQSYGISDSQLAPVRTARTSAFTGFSRIDWLLGPNSQMHFSGVVSAIPRLEATPIHDQWVGSRISVQGTDLHFAGGLDSRLGERFGQQLLIGWNRAIRDYMDPARTLPVSTTTFVDDVLTIGENPMLAGRHEAQAFRARATVHYRGREHQLKGGIAADFASYDFDFDTDRVTRFWFSNPAAFTNGLGYADHSRGAAQASFGVPRIGLFLQDDWAVGSRARVLLGLRWDYDKLPADRFRLNNEWLRLTGISVDSVKARHGRIAPRFEFEWQPDAAARWMFRASAGAWDAEIDPAVVAEAIAFDGSTTTRRGFGRFNDWPTMSDSGALPVLTLLTSGFQAPRSTRAAASLSRTFAPGFDLSVSVAFRRTEFLPRRSDANLLTNAVANDQYGRPIFGTLAKQGSVLGPGGGTERRFASFDRVSVIGVDGWSEYRGISAALKARPGRDLLLHASYTYSRTEDNWFMARSGNTAESIVPLPATGGVDWSESRSDFDTPHRLVLGAEVSNPMFYGWRAAALFRYQSGYPFTPGFRAGVDANGDGSMRNDPAFVDRDLPGFETLAKEHSCLRTQVGRFAGRNSCRAADMRSLDLRLAVGIYRTERRSAEIVLDALNLFASGSEERDHALLLVDPDREVVYDGSTVRIPLMLNPGFGDPLLRTTPGQMLRVGFRVTR